MQTQRWMLATALGLPIVALTGLAVRTWSLEGAQLELEQRQAVRGVALGIAARLERFGDGETWPNEFGRTTPQPPPALTQGDPLTIDRLALLRGHLARMLTGNNSSSATGAEAARLWLNKRATTTSDPAVAAWACLSAAALAQRAGDVERARVLRRTVAGAGATDAGPHPRDERGVRFDLAARALLLTDSTDPDDVADLARDLATDMRNADDQSTWALCQQVLETHANRAHPAARSEPPDASPLTQAIQRERRRAAWNSLRPTLTRRVVETPTVNRLPGPLDTEWLVALTPGTNDGEATVRGIPVSAACADLFDGATAELVDELGLVLTLRDADGRIWGQSSERGGTSAPEFVAQRDLPSGLGTVAATVGPEATARRAERRLAWIGILALAAGSAAIAGWLGLRALRRQQELTEEKAAFVAAVSHELRTPLTATRLLGEILERGGVDEARSREFGSRIARESERLDHLVRTVLDLARIEKVGLDPARTERLSVDTLFNDVVRRHEDVSAPATAPQLRRNSMPREAAAATVLVDREAVLAALANLLDNAVRHAPQSQTIELAAVLDGDQVRLEVRDRGPGIAPQDRTRVFEPFHRGGNEDTRRAHGTGIGLALVARIARVHGGHASCEARPGGGSVFLLGLPLAKEVEATA